MRGNNLDLMRAMAGRACMCTGIQRSCCRVVLTMFRRALCLRYYELVACTCSCNQVGWIQTNCEKKEGAVNSGR